MDLDEEGKSVTKAMAIPLLFVIVIVVIVLFVFNKCGSEKDYFKKEIIPKSIKAKILLKYADDRNHGILTLNLNSNGRLVKYCAEDWKGLFENASPGDSLIKESGSDYIKLIKYKPDTIMVLNYNFRGRTHLIKR